MVTLHETRIRHAKYYLEVLCRCEQFYLQIKEDPSEALDLLDKEWSNIVSANLKIV